MRLNKKVGVMLKFVSHSLGSGESWKNLEHERNLIRFELLGNPLGLMCKTNRNGTRV